MNTIDLCHYVLPSYKLSHFSTMAIIIFSVTQNNLLVTTFFFAVAIFMFACLLVVVGRFRPWRCSAGVSVLRSTMATKMTAETEVWSTDSATLGTCRPGWSCLRSCMSIYTNIGLSPKRRGRCFSVTQKHLYRRAFRCNTAACSLYRKVFFPDIIGTAAKSRPGDDRRRSVNLIKVLGCSAIFQWVLCINFPILAPLKLRHYGALQMYYYYYYYKRKLTPSIIQSASASPSYRPNSRCVALIRITSKYVCHCQSTARWCVPGIYFRSPF